MSEQPAVGGGAPVEAPVQAPVQEESEIVSPAALVALARVNLMPPTFARRAQVRRARVMAIIAIVVATLVAALAFLVSWQRTVAAEEELAQATFARTLVQSEVARYADVPLVFDAVNAAERQLQLAMGNEVRWSFFLNDLALTMPAGVSLDSLELTVIGPGQEPTMAGDGSGQAVGGLTVTGKALSFGKVANWLDSLAKMKTVADPYVSGLATTTEEATEVVGFNSTGEITIRTLSGRYTQEETP